jgi:hypothetical protein
MGLFSQDCIACGHPMLWKHQATTAVNEWMGDVVAISRDGEVHMGEYDGYGRVGGADHAVGLDGNTVWHRACWEEAGKPMDYRGSSRHSLDQGWFFNDEDHNMRDPRIKVVK